MKKCYDVLRYTGFSFGKPQYTEYYCGFKTKKAAQAYAEKQKILQENGYKIVKGVMAEEDKDE